MNSKEELRKKYKDLRDNIKNREEKSKEICELILKNEKFKEARTVAIYSSFSSEVDTKEIISKSLDLGKRVAVPKVLNYTYMEFFEIFSLQDISQMNSFKIMEPELNEKRKILKDEIDLMIIPGLCFDKTLNRLGYGRGYYDRYLKDENNIFKVGICFMEQIVEKVPATDEDVKMDIIITNLE